MSGASWAYASTDGSCTGVETPEGDWTGFATAGPEVAATLGGVPVAGARETDVTLGGEPTFYSILYVDTAANPDVLYTGDESADPARDATTPERRPNVLQAWRPRTKAP